MFRSTSLPKRSSEFRRTRSDNSSKDFKKLRKMISHEEILKFTYDAVPLTRKKSQDRDGVVCYEMVRRSWKVETDIFTEDLINWMSKPLPSARTNGSPMLRSASMREQRGIKRNGILRRSFGRLKKILTTNKKDRRRSTPSFSRTPYMLSNDNVMEVENDQDGEMVFV